MKINIKYLIFHMTILIIPLFALSSFFPFSLGNKLILGTMMIAYGYLNKLLIHENKKIIFFIYNFSLIVYIAYMMAIGQYGALTDIYFYSYVLMFTYSILFSNQSVIEEYQDFFKNNKKEFVYSVYAFYALVVISVVSGIGYRYSAVDKAWTLFGPFSVQHMLAYVLLVIYCGASIYDKENSNLVFLLMKVAVFAMTVLTGVRSAALALCLLVVCDYISMKNKSRKKTIVVIAIIGLVILATQTDILVNNSLMNKTVTAINNGSITNGREWYRKVQIDAFVNKSNVIQKLLGVSIPGVTEYMHQALRVHIQAHNDYINTLVGYGVIGFAFFLINQVNLCKVCDSFLSKIFLEFFIFLLAYYNGFTLYIMLTASLPIVLCFFKEKKVGKKRHLFIFKTYKRY